MKLLKKIILTCLLMLFLQFSFANTTANQQLSPQQTRAWLKKALHYGFAMQTTDYTKYISSNYIEHIDGKTFNFKQWQHHMMGLKALMKSYSLSFDKIVVEGNTVAASYVVHATKKDGTKLDIKVIAIFTLKNGKFVHTDELTYLIKGPSVDKNLSSQD